jgi:membrane-associated phospholipid phosphatase
MELSWSYRRFGAWDAGASAAGAAVILANLWVGPLEEPRWEGAILFDDPVRRALRGRSRSARDSARTVGDLFYRVGAVLPTLVDGLFVTLAVRRAPDVAGQMLLVNLEAYALTGAVLTTSENVVGRARPSAAPCELDPEYEAFCGKPDKTQSFPSGHVGVVAIGAGLTCAHHRYLGLYGAPWADAAACAVGLGTAVATGVARIVNDRHYASDVLSSLIVGTASGYAVPALLYYQAGGERMAARPWMLLPVMTPTALGLHWSQVL